jgi:hypothetical protein
MHRYTPAPRPMNISISIAADRWPMERIIKSSLAALTCIGFVSVAMADDVMFQQGQERIVRDSRTSEYVIEYIGNDGTLKTVRWTPATNIDVTVRSKFNQSNDRIQYRYAIKNHKRALQPVLGFRVLVRGTTKEDDLSAPGNWRASLKENFDDPAAGIWVSWTPYRSQFSLLPGENLSGLDMLHTELPGVGMARARGLMSVLTYPDEGPGGALIKFMEDGGFLKKASEGVSRLAAVPRIPNPPPFNVVVVLVGIQKHVMEDMASMQLIDPALLASIDRGLTQAIAAAQGGNTPSLLHEIRSLRQLLKQEHPDVDKDNDGDRDDDKEKKVKSRIDKLAARVLDFDLKYVEKRVKGDKD